MMRTGQAWAMRGLRWVATGQAGLRARRAILIAAVAHRGLAVVPAAAAVLLRGWRPAGVGLKDLGLHRRKGAGWLGQVVRLAEGLTAALRRGRWAAR